MSVSCKECVCFPVCDECVFRSFNAEGCKHYRRGVAHWIHRDGAVVCSGCGSPYPLMYEHCPGCGAEMREGE